MSHRLIEKARDHARGLERSRAFDGSARIILRLCDALEEAERENRVLRGENARLKDNWNRASERIRKYRRVFDDLKELTETLGFVADYPEAGPSEAAQETEEGKP